MTVASSITEKIAALDLVGAAARQIREDGKRIVLCHGSFDLLHIGHVRHLMAAKSYGDVLVVTITADEFIKKGPDRPVFAAQLRAEMLASLSFVDYVAVVHDPSAEPAIRAIQPSTYVKGSEYQDENNDITGKITGERKLVESLGGHLVFTHEKTFSSSNLLNRHFGAVKPDALTFLETLDRSGFQEEFDTVLAKVSGMKVLVIGEAIIDRYVYVDALGKAAKENILAARKREEENFAGGALAAANHIAPLCEKVELITMVGDPASGETHEALLKESAHPNLELTFLRRPSGPTVRKTRFVEPTYVRKLFEVYEMDDSPMPSDYYNGFLELVKAKLPQYDLVIVCDFGHGMMRAGMTELVETEAPYLAVNAQSNAGNIGFNLITKYNRADYVCVDLLEAKLASQDKHGAPGKLAKDLRSKINDCRQLVVTSGRHGCFVDAPEFDETLHIPSFSEAVVDTVGAGDAFFVVSSVFAAAGASPQMTAFAGNIAGALKVKIVGHRRSLGATEFKQYFSTLLK